MRECLGGTGRERRDTAAGGGVCSVEEAARWWVDELARLEDQPFQCAPR
jgi:hypothetical protein